MTEANRQPEVARQGADLPVAWREFILFCSELRHGEIERLSIQDGLPVLAEITKKKVKFNGRSTQSAT